MLNIKNGIILVFVIAGFLLPISIKDRFLLHILINIFIWSILTLGIRLVLLAGPLNLAQASFMGMGAYTSGLLAMRLGWSFWLCMPAAGLVTALLAVGIGYPTLRIKGSYFVMVTFGLTEVFRHLWMMWSSLFGGPQGLLGIPRPAPIHLAGLTIAFNSKVPFFYLALILFLITVFVMHRIDLSRMGLTLRAIPQADLLAECVGVNIMGYKVAAFAIGSFFAGIAGSFWAHYFTYCSPWDFTFVASFYMLMYAVMGGMGTVLGPIIGCFIMLGLDELLRPFKEYMPIILGVILIGILLYLPGGIISVPERVRMLWNRRQS
ncbi:MAG: branched-chain amino acid ABC transporter permease [Proteobacteria bacterium]|nr:branched-chain amino acid ABC transporter permease [Pseudomonadota bacterium]